MLNPSNPSKFHGNISEDMSLANLFEQIAANQKYGWLFLKYPVQEVCLYFQGDLVGLVTPPEKKLEYIPEKLYHAGVMSPENYNAVIHAQEPIQALEEKVPEDEITNMLNTICYDEICSLLSRHDGYFEFIDQNHPEANPNLVPIGRLFDTESLLIEVNDREKEWEAIYQSLPDWDEILVVADAAEAETHSNDNLVGNVLKLAQHRSIREILLFSYFSEFDTIRMVSSLISEKKLRIFDNQELHSYAAEFETKEDWDKAVRYYYLLFKRTPNDLAVCDALANCYEKTNRKEELAALFRSAAECLMVSNKKKDRTQGSMYLKKFADLLPDTVEEAETRLYLFDLAMTDQIDAKAIEYNILIEGKRLFQILRSRKEDAKARQILEKLMANAPHDKTLQSQYINVCLDLQDIATAVGQYESMAKIYEHDRNWQELAATYQKIIKLMPSRKDIVKKFEDLRTKKINRGPRIRRMCAMVFILILIGAGSWWGFRKWSHKNANDAQKTLDNKIDPEKEKISKWKREVEREVAREVEEIKKQTERLLDEGDIETSERLLQQALHKQTTDKNLENSLKELQNKIAQLRAEFNKCSQEIRSESSWDMAMRLYKLRFMELDDPYKKKIYNNLLSKDQILIPITVKISPAEAQFLVDDKTEELKENKLFLSPEFKKLEIVLRGYRSYIYYNPLLSSIPREGNRLSGRIDLEMEKLLLWKVDLGQVWDKNITESIGTQPLYDRGILYLFSGNSGRIYAFKELDKNPTLKWKNEIKASKTLTFVSFSHMPCLHNQVLYAIGNDNVLYIIDAQEGEKVERYSIPRGSVAVDSSTVVFSRGSSTWLLFCSSNNNLYALPLGKNQKRELLKIRSQIKSSPLVVEEKIILRGQDGYLNALTFEENGLVMKNLWKSDYLQMYIHIMPVVDVASSVLYTAAGRHLHGIDIKTGHHIKMANGEDWIFNIVGRIKGMHFNNNTIYITTIPDKVYAIATNGKEVWKNEDTIDGPFTTYVTVSPRDILYIANEKGTVYAVSTKTWKLKWSYNLGSKLTVSPMIIQDSVIFASDKLYAFSDN